MSEREALIAKARAAIKPTDSIELVRAFEHLAAERTPKAYRDGYHAGKEVGLSATAAMGEIATLRQERDYWRKLYEALAVFEQAHTPTSDEREALHREATLRADAAYPALNADDEVLSYPRAALRQHKRGAYITGFTDGAFRRTVQGEPLCSPYCDGPCSPNCEPQGEPTPVRFVARQAGKVQALIESLLAQANEHGIRVEVVYQQGEPTDSGKTADSSGI